MIKLLIADDHAIVRDGLKQLFNLYDDIHVAAEASSGGEVLEALRNDIFDLVLLDMSMNGVSGLELISHINTRYPKQRILILSMHAEPNIATSALKAGAHGYLSKDSDYSALVVAIRSVAGGGRFLDPALGVRLAFDSRSEESNDLALNLTEREYSIMQMFVQGMGVNEIAHELSISNKTVSTHKVRLMKKLSVDNNVELVRYAVKHGLG
ncbi:MAG: response regulator transcription factor [Candidatus Thiodiazotropha sp.]|jgi:DNA-binding NarL/FixJ family response regulator